MSKRRSEMQAIGDLPLLKNLAKQFKPPTKAQLELLDAATAIREAPDAVERAFMARQLVLCTLPHSDPGDVEAWTRKTAAGALSIQRGWDAEAGKPIGHPFGTVPRLLLYWITAEVQLTKNSEDMTPQEKRTLHLGHSLAQFMRDLGMNPDNGTGKRSDAKRLHEQMERFFAARISFQQTTQVSDEATRRRRVNMDVAADSELWWNPRNPEQGALWQSWMLLGEQFYDALLELPVPLDMRALRALKRSPLALDIYAWACFKGYVIFKKGLPPQFMAWSVLAKQLGGEYGNTDDFKRKAKVALRKVQAVYDGLSIAQVRGGFTIHANRLAVAEREATRALPSR